MGRSIVTKGSSTKEAINTALNLLDAMKDQVDIEIIETERKGWLGIGSSPAVIKATFRDSSSEIDKVKIMQPVDSSGSLTTEIEISEEMEKYNNLAQLKKTHYKRPKSKWMDLDGKVWVKDGQILCKNAPGSYPLISPGKGMKLFQNNKVVESNVVVDICSRRVLP